MKKKIQKLRELGLSYIQISKRLKIARSTVCYHLGVGQKEKSNLRYYKDHFKSKFRRKVDGFKNRGFSQKVYDFQKRERRSKLKSLSEKNFNLLDVLEKIGDNPTCYISGRKINLLDTKSYELDHIIPVDLGGKNVLDNLGLACSAANKSKHNMRLDEYILFCKEVLENNGFIVYKNGGTQ